MRKVLSAIIAAVMAVMMGLMMPKAVLASGDDNSTLSGSVVIADGSSTSILKEDMKISELLKLVLNILVYGIGAAAVLGVIIAGIMYMTARDNESQVAKAKTRLTEVVIGLIAWGVAFGLLNWLIPGGLSFNVGNETSGNTSTNNSGNGNNGNNNSTVDYSKTPCDKLGTLSPQDPNYSNWYARKQQYNNNGGK